MKKVGILGSGVVGKALANGFLKYRYSVMIGTRDITKLEDWSSKAGDQGNVSSFEGAAQFGEIIVLAVKGTVADEVLKLAGKDNLKGKTVIDATNPIAEEDPVNGVLRYFTGMNESLMERLQVLVPEANFVKAFNSVGSAFMVDPDFNGTKPTMFICGKDDDSRREVAGILETFGWEIEDMGKAEAARAIEPLAMLWCIPGFRENRWDHAFKLLKKQEFRNHPS